MEQIDKQNDQLKNQVKTLIKVTKEAPSAFEELSLDYSQEMKHVELYNDILEYQKCIKALELERQQTAETHQRQMSQLMSQQEDLLNAFQRFKDNCQGKCQMTENYQSVITQKRVEF